MNQIQKPLISMVVPVYNVEKTLKRCVDSIIQQRYKNIEILLINDGSTDNSACICQQYMELDRRITVYSKKNGGLSSARNLGIEKAQGEYICFIDSDDWISDQYVEVLFTLIEKNNADIAACGYYCTKDTNDIPFNNSEEMLICDSQTFLCLCLYNRKAISVFAWNKLYRKELFEKIRYPEGKLYEDIVPMFLLSQKATTVAVTFNRLYCYYVNSESITQKKYNERDEDYIEQWLTAQHFCEDNFPELHIAIKYRIAFAHFRLLNKLLFTEHDKFKTQKKQHLLYLRKNFFFILFNSNFSRLEKAQISLLILSYSLYSFLYKRAKKSKLFDL